MKLYWRYEKVLKKILALSLSGCIVFTTTFLSYENVLVAKAADYEDILRDAVNVALSAFGVFAAVNGGAAITPALLLPFITNIAGTGFDVYDYVTDNGDGTTTISEEFIQLVAQAYQQYKDENADLFDGSLNMTQDGYYYFPEIEVTVSRIGWDFPSKGFTGTVRFTDIYSLFPCAVWLKHTNDHVLPVIIYYNYATDKFYSSFYGWTDDDDIKDISTFSTFNPKQCTKTYVDVRVCQSYFDSFSIGFISGDSGPSTTMTASSSSIPIYSSLEALKQGLKTEDFSAAHNYGTIPDIESSKYTGFYEGGDITVTNEKLSGISAKLDEINDTGKSIDDKLKDLLDWLGAGESSGSTPSGIIGWLEKIYGKLADMLKQLKSIKRWTVVDTVVNGVDAVADWLDLIHDIISDADDGMESAVSTLSSALDDSAGLLKKKFPFSVPWDILAFVTLFAAEPEVPHFEIPIDIGVSAVGLDIHYDFVVDFSDYQYLSDVLRAVLSLTYAVGLIKMTAGIASTKKEE